MKLFKYREEKMNKKNIINQNISRRKLMKGAAAAGSIAAMPGFVRYSQAASSAPIKSADCSVATIAMVFNTILLKDRT